MKRLFLTLLGLVILMGLGGAGWLFLYAESHPDGEGRDIVFDLQKGSFSLVAHDLEREGLTTSAFKLKILARLTGYSNRVRIGEYALRTDMTPLDILKVISSGKSILHPLTVVEGANIFDVADLIEKKGFGKKSRFLSLCRNPDVMRAMLHEALPSCEGYLFPETYGVTKYTDEKAILQQMIDRFLQNYEKIESVAQTTGLTRHQLVTLASIVEKETGAPEERPIISSIYNNRLRLGMKLQADPTVLYGKWLTTGKFGLSITKLDLVTPNAYNTYMKTGLPFGPIANPGLEAMRAAALPAKTDYLFFVSRNDGTSVFSREYKDHDKAVHQFQQNARARQGKSWRDLAKKRKTLPKSSSN